MMPACTGLPPGQLMRSTTACALVVLERALQRGDDVLGVRLGFGGDLAAHFDQRGVRPGRRGRRWLRATKSAQHDRPARDQPREAEEHPPAALAAAVAQHLARELLERAVPWRAAARRRRRGRRQRGRRPAAGGGADRQGFMAGFRGRPALGALRRRRRRLGCRAKDTNTPARRAPRLAAASAGRGRTARRRNGRRPARRPRRGSSRGSSACPLSRNSPGCQSISVGTWAQRLM